MRVIIFLGWIVVMMVVFGLMILIFFRVMVVVVYEEFKGKIVFSVCEVMVVMLCESGDFEGEFIFI